MTTASTPVVCGFAWRNPSTKALAKLARALGVTLSALFENVG
jgi:hypothetical protein